MWQNKGPFLVQLFVRTYLIVFIFNLVKTINSGPKQNRTESFFIYFFINIDLKIGAQLL